MADNTTLELRKVEALEKIANNTESMMLATERIALVLNSFENMADAMGDGAVQIVRLLPIVLAKLNPEFGKLYDQAMGAMDMAPPSFVAGEVITDKR